MLAQDVLSPQIENQAFLLCQGVTVLAKDRERMSDKFFPWVFELTEELQENDLGLEFVRLRG